MTYDERLFWEELLAQDMPELDVSYIAHTRDIDTDRYTVSAKIHVSGMIIHSKGDRDKQLKKYIRDQSNALIPTVLIWKILTRVEAYEVLVEVIVPYRIVREKAMNIGSFQWFDNDEETQEWFDPKMIQTEPYRPEQPIRKEIEAMSRDGNERSGRSGGGSGRSDSGGHSELRLVRVLILDPDDAAWDDPKDAVVYDSGEHWTYSDDDSVTLELEDVSLQIQAHNLKRRETIDPVAVQNSGNNEAKLLPKKINDYRVRVVNLLGI